MTDGEYFGETDLVSDKPSDVTVRTITPCILLTLSLKDLDAALKEKPNLTEEFKKASPNTRNCGPRSIAMGNGISTLSRALPRTWRSPRRSWTTRPIPANIPCRPCKRSCACIRAFPTCTTTPTTSSKSRCD